MKLEQKTPEEYQGKQQRRSLRQENGYRLSFQNQSEAAGINDGELDEQSHACSAGHNCPFCISNSDDMSAGIPCSDHMSLVSISHGVEVDVKSIQKLKHRGDDGDKNCDNFEVVGDEELNGYWIPPIALSWTSKVLLVVALYVVLYLALGGDLMAPGGHVFNLMATWACAVVVGALARCIKLPPLIGMIASGTILKNLASFGFRGVDIVDLTAMPPMWKEMIRSTGLAIILLRSGLDLDIKAMEKVRTAALMLTVFPGVLEACMCAYVSRLVFGFPWALAFTMGFELAAVSPAVVVTSMLALESKGYGVEAGIPTLVIAAASFDDVVAISGFSIAMALAFPSDSLVKSIIHGPMSLVIGVTVGLVGSFVLSFTGLWNKRWKRSALTVLISFVIMFGTGKMHMVGAGAMGNLIMGVATATSWKKVTRRVVANHDALLGRKWVHDTEKDLQSIWSKISEPLLFSVIGTSLDLGAMSIKWQSIVIVFAGLGIRIPMAFCATLCKQLTTKERFFIAIAWIPKATVQAALCAVPLDYVLSVYGPSYPEYQQYISWATDLQATAILSILISAPLGLILIKIFGKRWLTSELDPKSTKDALRSKNVSREGMVGRLMQPMDVDDNSDII